MNNRMVIMDFSGAYREESFYRHQKFDWVDCTNIQGVTYMCDLEAQNRIKMLIKEFSPEGIHFIDSGNYHYVSKLWIDKILQPFVLVVFDHHPDMQPTLFSNLMSCGCWVKDVIDTNKLLQKVVIIGAADSLVEQIPVEYRSRVLFFSESQIHQKSSWHSFVQIHFSEPLYLSIDKDVLSPNDASTSWDAGSMTLEQLKLLLTEMMHRNQIIGLDVCGECPSTLSMVANHGSIKKNDDCNKVILTLAEMG